MGAVKHSGVDAFRYMLGKGVPGAAGVLTALVLIRVSGSQVYADYSLLTTFTISWCSLWLGWMNQAQLRFAKINAAALKIGPNGKRAVVRSAYALICWTAAFLGALICCGYWYEGAEPGVADFLPFFFIFFGHAFYISNSSVLQANLASKSVLRVELFRGVLLLFLPLLFYWNFRNSVGGFISSVGLLSSGFAVAVCATAMLGRREVARTVGASRRRSRGTYARSLALIRCYWKYGWPMAFWLGMSTGMPVVERLILKDLGAQDVFSIYVSLYEVVFKVFALFLFPITMALHPRVMLLYNEGDTKGSNRIIYAGVFFQVLISFFVVSAFLVFRPYFLLFLKIPELSVDWLDILVLASSGAIWQVALMVHKPLERLNKTRLMMFGMFLSFLVVAVGDAFWGAHGGVLRVSLVNFLSAAVYVVFVLCVVFFGRFSRAKNE